jgi:hypothetical protein
MEREKFFRILRVLKTFKEEYPGIYRKYTLLPKEWRLIIMRDLLSSRTKEDIFDVITDIRKKYDTIILRNRKLLGL